MVPNGDFLMISKLHWIMGNILVTVMWFAHAFGPMVPEILPDKWTHHSFIQILKLKACKLQKGTPIKDIRFFCNFWRYLPTYLCPMSYVLCNIYLCIRRPLGSTNQSNPSCFYFRISWILMEQCCFYYFFSAGPQE